MDHSINIKSSPFSFVNFNDASAFAPCCDGDNDVCLPVYYNSDLVFQFTLECSDSETARAAMNANPESAQLILLDVDGYQLYNFTLTGGLYFKKYRVGLTTVVFVWDNNLAGLESYVGFKDCFSLKVDISFYVNKKVSDLATSNCFKRIFDTCFTTLFEYNNETDYAEMYYCNTNGFTNRVRLFVDIGKPKLIEDKTVYRKSNGAIRQTRSLITKELSAITERFSEFMHDRVSVMLAHDNVLATINNNSKIGVSKNGEYQIDWEDNFCLALGSFKLLQTPFAIKNNNCSDCAPLVFCGVLNDIIGTAFNGVLGCDEPVFLTLNFDESNNIILTWDDNPVWVSIKVQISSDGISFGDLLTTLPTSPLNLGTSLNNTGVKYFRLIGVCSEGESDVSNVLSINTSPGSYLINYINNILSQPFILKIGNLDNPPAITIYNGDYSTDPISGTDVNLPADNANVELKLPGASILAATLNWELGLVSYDTVTWTGVNGNISINITTF